MWKLRKSCCWAGCGCDCFGLAPEVEGVGDEFGVLAAGKALELELVGDAGGSGGAGGATGGDDVVDGPEVGVSERRSNCIGTQGLCLLLQSRICRCPRFRKWSTVVSP
jgi:hypothetical protein